MILNSVTNCQTHNSLDIFNWGMLNLEKTHLFLIPVTWNYWDAVTRLSEPVCVIYKDLFPGTVQLMEPFTLAWEAAAPGLDGVDWDDVWEAPFRCLVSTRDCLIHYTFLHRIYLTPTRLARIYRGQLSLCWRCSAPFANFLHIFGECPYIKLYWQEIVICIQSVTSILISLLVELCLVELLATTRAIHTLLTHLLFYARKLIILSWKKSAAPTLVT